MLNTKADVASLAILDNARETPFNKFGIGSIDSESVLLLDANSLVARFCSFAAWAALLWDSSKSSIFSFLTFPISLFISLIASLISSFLAKTFEYSSVSVLR